MRKVIVFFFCLFYSFAQGQTEDLQGHYQLNGNFSDSSLNQIEGVGIDVNQAVGLEGLENTAYSFNGNNAFIDLGESSRSIEDLVSVSAWIKTTNDKRQFVVSKYNSSEGRGYFMGVENGIAFLGGRYDNDEFVQTYGTTSINDGEWHHIIGVVDGKSWTIWVDCKIENTIESLSNYSKLNCSDPLTVGSWFQGNGFGEFRFFDGIIDEVKIFSVNILEDELLRLCDADDFISSNSNNILQSVQSVDTNIYPNPTNDLLNIEIETNNNRKLTFGIYDMNGALVFETNQAHFSTKNLKNGTYLLKVLEKGIPVGINRFVKL